MKVAEIGWDDRLASFSGSRTEVADLVAFCKVFSCEDAMRWAMQAYMAASRFLAASEGPWVEGGMPWSTPHGFADDFQHEFERRLWDACQRSPRYREVEGWRDSLRREADPEPDLLRLQMPELPQCGTVPVESEGMGVSGAA